MHRTLLLALLLALPLAGTLRAAPADASLADVSVEATLSEDADLPEGYALSAPYPNPFNPRTTFTLTVESTQQVAVEVFNLLGQPVRTLFNGRLEANAPQTLSFEASELHTGIYLIRVQGETFTASRQVTLLK